MGKKWKLGGFECGVVVGASISETAELLGFPTQSPLEFTKLFMLEIRGE